MAPKSDLSLFTVTFLLLFITLSSLLSIATAKEAQNSSPFGFLERLKGCHKGDEVKGINDLKKYLHKFGYLNYKNRIHYDSDDFDELLEEAVKTYQLNFHLKSTGTLDEKTISQMMMPRCGVPDIINGTTSMRSASKIKSGKHSSIHTTLHYAFFNGNPKWPPSKYSLTYGFLPGTPSEATGAIRAAFTTWAKNTHFKFSQAKNHQSADLKVSFHRRDHGDGDPFDGKDGALAHAFAPTDGRLHFDQDENWVVGSKPDTTDYESVAVHEIGHLLGLEHSSVQGATMFPSLPVGALVRGLHQDDIQGIKALYNQK